MGGGAAVKVVTYFDSKLVEFHSMGRGRDSIRFVIGVAVSSFLLPVGQVVRFRIRRVFLNNAFFSFLLRKDEVDFGRGLG